MTTAVQVIEPGTEFVPVVSRNLGLLRPLAEPAAVVEAQNATRALVTAALKEGRDFGKVPGTDKPSLLKPGAERLALGFGLAPRFRIIESEIDHDRPVQWRKVKKDWSGPKGQRTCTERVTEGDSVGLYRFVIECEMVHRESQTVIAACIGSCSSMESKYVDRPRDVENTIVKMAEKRAFVGATLLALGLSDEFTQDVEDLAANGAIESAADPDAQAEPEAACPVCQGRMWDNRATKKNPKAPDYKCRDKECKGAYWPGQWPPPSEATPEAKSEPAQPLLWPSGTFEGKKISELPTAFLHWASEEGRKFGDRTEELQDACRLELDARTNGDSVEPARAQAAAQTDDDLPF